jgi:histone H3
MDSRSFSSDSSGQLHVLGHDGDSLGVDGAEVGVFEETDQVGLGGFLEGEDSGGLESEVSLELSSDFSNQSLERKFSNEEFGALLESSDFSEGDCAGSESVRLLDSASVSSSSFLGSLVSNVLSGGFATGVLSCGLFCSGHFVIEFI